MRKPSATKSLTFRPRIQESEDRSQKTEDRKTPNGERRTANRVAMTGCPLLAGSLASVRSVSAAKNRNLQVQE
jgi:hypothetical protein